ncbi:hypothetical protein GCM10010305_39530 [Streptomyces termitum]|uniref:Uncharacterized protein n=2 Tax=Streptomyces termitum TaxID=67368 RepID=A0A918WAZ1_9ACTN|nr:hypothetical protein GCM10010305_39530 [Streptomyces termitum]
MGDVVDGTGGADGAGKDRAAERDRAVGASALLWLAAVGVVAVFLAVWGVEAVAPVVRESAVIGHADDGGGDDGGPESPAVKALTGDGRAVPLGEAGGILRPFRLGDAVVVTRSRVTGRPLAVRGPGGEADLHTHGGIVVLLAVSGVVVGVTCRYGRRVYAAARRLPLPGPVRRLPVFAVPVAGAALAGLTLFGPGGSEGRPWTLDGMGIYDAPEFFPGTVVPSGGTADVRGFSLRVGGPLAEGAPAGAPGRLAGLRVLVAEVVVRNGREAAAYLPVQLVGEGRGRAALLAAGECGAAPGGFDGHVPVRPAPVSRMCFVVPEGFAPRYLIVGGADDDVALAVSAR